MIEEQFRGKAFRQIAPRLRWKQGGSRVDSFRPMNEETGQIVGEPPVITFADDAEVDVGNWIARGRIEPTRARPSAPLTDHEAHRAGKALLKEGAQPAAEEGGNSDGSTA